MSSVGGGASGAGVLVHHGASNGQEVQGYLAHENPPLRRTRVREGLRVQGSGSGVDD